MVEIYSEICTVLHDYKKNKVLLYNMVHKLVARCTWGSSAHMVHKLVPIWGMYDARVGVRLGARVCTRMGRIWATFGCMSWHACGAHMGCELVRVWCTTQHELGMVACVRERRDAARHGARAGWRCGKRAGWRCSARSGWRYMSRMGWEGMQCTSWCVNTARVNMARETAGRCV